MGNKRENKTGFCERLGHSPKGKRWEALALPWNNATQWLRYVTKYNLPVTIKLTWLLNSVNILTRSAAWLTIKHIFIVVIIFPAKSRRVGSTKYITATNKNNIIAIAWNIGFRIFLIRKFMSLQFIFTSGTHTNAYEPVMFFVCAPFCVTNIWKW